MKNTIRLLVAALAVSVFAFACSRGKVGYSGGATPQVIADGLGVNGFAAVQPNNALTTLPGNLGLPALVTAPAAAVKTSPGSVYQVQIITRDTTNPVYVQLANNVFVEAGAQSGTAPAVQFNVPAAAATATNYPGYPITEQFSLPGTYFDAGISMCLSLSSSTCTFTGLDAGSYNVHVVYQ